MSQFNIAEAKANFSTLVKQAMMGEEIIIAKDNRPLLRLTPITQIPAGRRQPGSAKSKLAWMAPDFDAIPEEFGDYA